MSEDRLTALVIDGESAIRDMIAFTLERAGMSVNQAADATVALELQSEKI